MGELPNDGNNIWISEKNEFAIAVMVGEGAEWLRAY